LLGFVAFVLVLAFSLFSAAFRHHVFHVSYLFVLGFDACCTVVLYGLFVLLILRHRSLYYNGLFSNTPFAARHDPVDSDISNFWLWVVFD
jgi:hypothetical protein